MTEEEATSAQEVSGSVGPSGVSGRAKGYRLVDLIWLPMVLAMGYTSMTLYQHDSVAQEQKRELAATLKDSNRTIADALKESNASQKEQTTAIVNALNRLEKRTAEVACLSDPAMKNRADARDFCRRLARDDR